MRMYDVIKKKRDGGKLSNQEIQWFIKEYVAGNIPDYQAAALCMAIYFRGMDVEETAALTFAVRDSGERLDLSKIHGIRVDKHSTGGVGDKTSLVVAPIVASFGVKVAKMSGRGMGHTGGTIDKLEAIEGFQTDLPVERFENIVEEIGLAIVGQTKKLAPADKLLYALRDVTATVDSLPLIVSSIMGKKLAANDDCIVLDVKTCSGSFMKTVEESRALAQSMVEIGKRAGKKILALVTDMGTPLGNAIGNSMEVVEAIHTLRGQGPEDTTTLSVALAAHILYLAGKGSISECEKLAQGAIADGSALEMLARMVEAQGGNRAWIENPELFPTAKYTRAVLATQEGYITQVDAEGYGVASQMLGAGRSTKEDSIDPVAGIYLKKKVGDYLSVGEEIACLYASEESLFAKAEERLLQSTVIGKEKPTRSPILLEVVE